MGKREYAIMGIIVAIIVAFVFGFTFFFTELSKTSNENEVGNELCHVIEQGSIWDDRVPVTYFECNWSDGTITKCVKTAMGISCEITNSRFG